MRKQLTLTGSWHCISDGGRIGESAGYPSPAHDISSWPQVTLPGVTELQIPGLEHFTGPVWYRKTIDIPAAWKGQLIFFRCEGANYHSTLYVNGQPAGTNTTGFLPFEFDITPLLRPGESNTLTLRVDADVKPQENPGKLIGWRNFAGVLRDLYLEARQPVHIASIAAMAEPTATGGRLRMTVRPNDTTVDIAIIVRRTGNSWYATSDAWDLEWVDIADVRPWTPQTPNLYDFDVDLLVDGKVVDRQSLRLGFRKVETRDGKILLNGQPIYLCGFNRHEDSPHTAMASDPHQAKEDLRRMKLTGANFVRLCHYPHDPRELDLCDELGLLAMCEIPLYWLTTKDGREDECARKLEQAQSQLTTLVRRDFNHPSVVFWSVSNETDESCYPVAEGNQHLIRKVREMDRSRLVVHVSNWWYTHPSFEHDDVICINAYPNVWPFGKRPEKLEDSSTIWREAIEQLHTQFPNKPILITEFGYPAIEGELTGHWGQTRQSEVIAAESAGFDAPYVCGQTLWCFADHAWPPGVFMDGLGTSPFGVVTRNRQPKQALQTLARIYRARTGMCGDFELAMPPGDQNVIMRRPDLANIPQFQLPQGFSVRGMKPGDAALWTDIWRDADPSLIMGDDLFTKEYGNDWALIEQRCLLVIAPTGRAVGTISAWVDVDLRPTGGAGRIHWVALRREWHGQGLAQPMMTAAMNILASHHQTSYLVTQAFRLPAIRLYLNFGFTPDLSTEQALKMWRYVASRLDHPGLKGVMQATEPSQRVP